MCLVESFGTGARLTLQGLDLDNVSSSCAPDSADWAACVSIRGTSISAKLSVLTSSNTCKRKVTRSHCSWPVAKP